MKLTRFVQIAVIIALGCSLRVVAADYKGAVQGIVKTSAGAPFAGAYVKLKNADKRLTFLVVSGAGGKYVADHLPPGQYVVQGVGGGFQSGMSAAANVTEGAPAIVDLALTDPQAEFIPRKIGGGSREAPQITLPEGEGKQIVLTKCSACHGAEQIVNQRASKEHWAQTVDEMRTYIQNSSNATDLTETQVAALLNYLDKNFSDRVPGRAGQPRKPVDPNSHFPRTAAAGQAARYVAVQFETPRHPMGLHEISVDGQGNGWVTERTAIGGKLGRLDAKTLVFTEVAVPPAKYKNKLQGIWFGADNKLWFADVGANRRMYAYDPVAKEFGTFQMPPVKNGNVAGNTIRDHPNGTVWFNAIINNEVMRLDPRTKKWDIFEVPIGAERGSILGTYTANPYGLVVGGDGFVYLALNAVSKIGRVDPVSGHIEMFDIPIPDSAPKKGEVDSKGNVWFALQNGNALLKFDIKTKKISTYTPPTQATGIYAATIDRHTDMVWYCTQWTHQVGRFDPKTETWVEFYLPNAESDVRRCQVDQNHPNRVWWSGNNSDWMGYVEMLP